MMLASSHTAPALAGGPHRREGALSQTVWFGLRDQASPTLEAGKSRETSLLGCVYHNNFSAPAHVHSRALAPTRQLRCAWTNRSSAHLQTSGYPQWLVTTCILTYLPQVNFSAPSPAPLHASRNSPKCAHQLLASAHQTNLLAPFLARAQSFVSSRPFGVNRQFTSTNRSTFLAHFSAPWHTC